MANVMPSGNNVRLGKTQKDKFRNTVKDYVEKVGKIRLKDGVCESEADYFAGAMAVMFIVNEMYFGADPDNVADITPPMWFIGPMSGRSLEDDWGLGNGK